MALWGDTDLVQEHLERSFQFVASEHGNRYVNHAHANIQQQKCAQLGSPAEAVFELWILALTYAYDSPFRCQRQVPVKGRSGKEYRADFQIGFSTQPRSPTLLPLIVEIDGHQWHEKTRKQVEARNFRDRDLTAAGFTMLHFSFTELVGDPLACVNSIHGIGWRLAHSLIDMSTGNLKGAAE